MYLTWSGWAIRYAGNRFASKRTTSPYSRKPAISAAITSSLKSSRQPNTGCPFGPGAGGAFVAVVVMVLSHRLLPYQLRVARGEVLKLLRRVGGEGVQLGIDLADQPRQHPA